MSIAPLKHLPNHLTLAEVRNALAYDPVTGALTRKSGHKNSGHGLRQRTIRVRGINIRAARIAWALHYGKWPQREIDHVNGDALDHRICNLREANRSENCANRRAFKNNAIGLKGVTKNGAGYMARVRKDGNLLYLGTYPTAEEAHSNYLRVAKALHGEFAR